MIQHDIKMLLAILGLGIISRNYRVLGTQTNGNILCSIYANQRASYCELYNQLHKTWVGYDTSECKP